MLSASDDAIPKPTAAAAMSGPDHATGDGRASRTGIGSAAAPSPSARERTEAVDRRGHWEHRTGALRLHRLARISTFAPLGAIAMLYVLVGPFRDALNTGCELLLEEDVSGIADWASGIGWWAPVATSVLMLVQALAFPLPAFVITFANSLMFGWFWGGVLSIVSASLAACICFMLARVLGEPFARAFISRRVLRKTNDFMDEFGTRAVLTARLIPLMPFDPISFVAGLTQMRMSSFFMATMLGQIPAGFTYSYIGGRLDDGLTYVALYIASSTLALLVLSSVFVTVLRREKRSSQPAVGEGESRTAR